MLSNKRRALVFSLAFFPMESGAEIAARKIMELNSDISFDVVTWRFRSEWKSFERISNINIYRIGWPTKYGYVIGGLLKSIWLSVGSGYDFSWSIMAGYSGGVALWYKILFSKTPLILTLQEGDPMEHILKRVGVLRPFFKMLFKKADRVQAISKYLAVWAKEMGYQGEPIVIPNGTDVDQSLAFRDCSLKNKKQIVLISNSRLERKNGLDIVIKALKFLPENVVFRNAHRGSEREKLLELASELNVSNRVTLDNFLPYEKGIDYLRQGDIFVRPSRSEGLGNSFLEAMAIGLPIIATPVGGIPDFLYDGVTGIMCQPENPESFALAVMKLVNNPELYSTIRVAAFKLMKEKYTWQRVAHDMREVFKV